MEMWAGFECTVNRVGDVYSDQIERSGHVARIEDLDLLAKHGIRVMRYPVLWERTAPDEGKPDDWEWSDRRLARLNELGIQPIVGLLHHGSGPRHTHLLDDEFPEKFAAYAERVARRYPWITHYTPINEPLTTARFSCLYGLWYPHRRNDRAFVRSLLNQTKATALAMEAIRRVRPDAKLVQTEDLGAIGSTGRLLYQSRFENHRRWLSWDLLSGFVGKDHPLWPYLRKSGATPHELSALVRRPCPPDVIGVNHYVTSNRYLDHRLALYPVGCHGGNGKHRYADVEAVRAKDARVDGLGALLKKAWQRYGTAIAVTEAHIGCTREEQLRWLSHVWDEAQGAKAEGADVRAVTVWSFLGAFDWDSLLTLRRNHYEPGAYDLTSGRPRATALTSLVSALASGTGERHPVAEGLGWWQRTDRFYYGSTPETRVTRSRSPLLITGATGTLGRAFARICELRGIDYRLCDRQALDIADPRSVRQVFDETKPWGIVNAAGYVRVDDAEEDEARCFRENAEGPAVLASECADRGVRLLTFSSDLVFDGKLRSPYRESASPSPLNVYGRSKVEGERRVLGALPEALVVRTGAFFGPWDSHNFITVCLSRLQSGLPVIVTGDCLVSPTYVPDLVNASLDLLIDGERGVWHLANQGEVSWADLARLAAETAKLSTSLIQVLPIDELRLRAVRPLYSVLGSERGPLGSLEKALEKYWTERLLDTRRAVG